MPVGAGEARRPRERTGHEGRFVQRVHLSGESSGRPESRHEASEARDRIHSFSPAEREVVRELSRGLSPKEVAVLRMRSLATVRTQIKRAKKKSGARTLNELVALFCTAGEYDRNVVISIDSNRSPHE